MILRVSFPILLKNCRLSNADSRDTEYTESGHKKTAAFDDMNLKPTLIRGGKSQ